MKLLFPSVIHELKVEKFKSLKNRLVQFAYEQREKDPQGVSFSNKGGWQSQPTYKDYNNILLSTVSDTLRSYFNQNVVDMTKGINFDGLWININKKGDRNDTHNHPNCHLAGVFWIKCPKEGGILRFQNPNNFPMAAEMMVYTDNFKKQTNCYHDYWFTPVEGNMLLFPASLNHKVTPNTSHEDRISSSFNLTFKI